MPAEETYGKLKRSKTAELIYYNLCPYLLISHSTLYATQLKPLLQKTPRANLVDACLSVSLLKEFTVVFDTVDLFYNL